MYAKGVSLGVHSVSRLFLDCSLSVPEAFLKFFKNIPKVFQENARLGGRGGLMRGGGPPMLFNSGGPGNSNLTKVLIFGM